MPSVLITGANRGIGLEFARQYSADGWDVIATARQSSPELGALGVRIETLDMANAEDAVSFATRIDEPLDLFVANAGTNHPMQGESAEEARAWQSMMMVNAIGPYLIANSLIPRMSEGAKMVAISSGMASIADNGGGWVPYRTSKAALNMAWSSLALQTRGRGVTCVVLSPGWVKTRMGGAGADISPEQSVADMRRLIGGLAIGDTGRFLRRDGSDLPW